MCFIAQEVDDQLKAIDEQQNIDISLAMGAPTARRPTHDQMDIAQKQTLRLGRNRTVSTEMAAVGSMVSISRSTSLNKVFCLMKSRYLPLYSLAQLIIECLTGLPCGSINSTGQVDLLPDISLDEFQCMMYSTLHASWLPQTAPYYHGSLGTF